MSEVKKGGDYKTVMSEVADGEEIRGRVVVLPQSAHEKAAEWMYSQMAKNRKPKGFADLPVSVTDGCSLGSLGWVYSQLPYNDELREQMEQIEKDGSEQRVIAQPEIFLYNGIDELVASDDLGEDIDLSKFKSEEDEDPFLWDTRIKHLGEEWWKAYNSAPELAMRRMEFAIRGNRYWRGMAEECPRSQYVADVVRLEYQMSRIDFAYLAEHFPKKYEKARAHFAKMRDFLGTKTEWLLARLGFAYEQCLSILSDCERARVEETVSILERKDRMQLDRFAMILKAAEGDGEMCQRTGFIFNDYRVWRETECVESKKYQEIAAFWYEHGARAGNADCFERLLWLYGRERSKIFNKGKALYWLHEMLWRDIGRCRYLVAYEMTVGEEWSKAIRNPILGVEILEDGIKNDEKGDFHYCLGLCYQQGVGVETNVEKAKELFVEAANRYNWEAREKLKELFPGMRVEKFDEWEEQLPF